MQTYLAAHDDFVAWLDRSEEPRNPEDMDRRLWDFAVCAAQHGMSEIHWAFVVDGLVAYVNRKSPGNILLSSQVARGFDLSSNWGAVRAVAAKAINDV